MRRVRRYSIEKAHEVSPFMIICSCNVLTDHEIRLAVSSAEARPRTAGQVYGCLGCSPQCGRCARSIKRIMDEALGCCRAADACCAASLDR